MIFIPRGLLHHPPVPLLGTVFGSSDGPSLDLNLLGPTLDPRLTFARASSADEWSQTGVLQSVAANVPRFDYDPVSHAARGLLIEGQRTNYANNSANLTGANWAAGNLSVVQGQPSPDGASAAVLMTDTVDSVVSEHDFTFTFTPAPNTTYTWSCFIKAPATKVAPYVEVSFRVATAWTAGNVVASVSPANGAVQSGSAPSTVVTPEGNGWYRVSVTATSVASPPSAQVRVELNNGTTDSYVGAATYGAIVWGAQLEVGRAVTSYIPTGTSVATRAQDFCSTPLGPWFNPNSGTFVVEAILPALGVTNQFLLSTTDSSGNNAIQIWNQGSTNNVYGAVAVGGTQYLPTTGGVLLTAGAVFRAGIAWSPTLATFCVRSGSPLDGSVASVALPGVPSGETNLAIGAYTPTNTTWASPRYIRRIICWPRFLSLSELQQQVMA